MDSVLADTLKEEWRPIDGFGGQYLVSSLGRVLSLPKCQHNAPLILKPKNDGYLRVTLFKDKKHRAYPVHRLVAEAFIPNTRGCPQVNHIDEDKTNNRVDNLEWVTVKENANHGTRKARIKAKQLNNVHACPVEQMDENGNIVARYASCSEIPRVTRFKRNNIVECLRGRINTAYGFKWRYEKGPWKKEG